jgi:hypothetical protein
LYSFTVVNVASFLWYSAQQFQAVSLRVDWY